MANQSQDGKRGDDDLEDELEDVRHVLRMIVRALDDGEVCADCARKLRVMIPSYLLR